jgi:hypothetical protein
MPDYATAIVVLLTLASWELIKKLIGKYWDKTVETDYVTVTACKACRDECHQKRSKKNDESLRLLKSLGSEVKSLRLTIIKHMVHSKAPAEAIEEALGGKQGVSNG